MKTTIRLLALLLALVMFAAVFAACGTKTTEPKQGGDDDTDTDTDDDFPAQLKGINYKDDPKTIRFVVAGGDEADETSSGQARSIALSESDDPDYNVNAAVLERNKNVETYLGTKIERTKVVGMQGLGTELQEILAGSLDTYDVVAGYQYFDMGLAFGNNAGSFLNYNTISADDNFINLDAKYWDRDTFDKLAYKKAGYWITGDLCQLWVGTPFVAFINQRLWGLYKDVIEEITGYTDVYDVVEHNKWTMDTLSKISSRIFEDKDGNDKPSKGDILGYAGTHQDINNCEVDALAAGCHVNYSKMVDGIPKIDFNTERNMQFGEALVNLLTKSNAYVPPYADEDDDTVRDVFCQGNVLCIVYGLNVVEDKAFTEMVDDYYVIPCPMLDEAQAETYGYSSMIGDCVSQYGIPWTNQYVDATTATLELMAYYSLNLTTPAYYDVCLKNRYSRDTKTADTIDTIRGSIYSDFAALWSSQLGNITWFFRENCENRRIASTLKGKEKAWTGKLEVLLKDLETSTEVEK